MTGHWRNEMTYADKSAVRWAMEARQVYHQLSRGKVVTNKVSERLEIRRCHGLTPMRAARGVVLQAAQEIGIDTNGH